jgi:hypothetical protein
VAEGGPKRLPQLVSRLKGNYRGLRDGQHRRDGVRRRRRQRLAAREESRHQRIAAGIICANGKGSEGGYCRVRMVRKDAGQLPEDDQLRSENGAKCVDPKHSPGVSTAGTAAIVLLPP